MAQQTYQERYQSLNAAQKKAVDTIEGPVLVVAGPGSGKTELLSMRVANILLQTDASPHTILCLTFTETAALAMRHRLAGLIGPEAYRVAIHTFHSFGTEIINRHPEFFYSGATVSPADELTQRELLQELFDVLPHDNPLASRGPEGYTYLKDSLRAIGELKKAGLRPEEFGSILDHNERTFRVLAEPVESLFSKRVDRRDISGYQNFLVLLQSLPTDDFPVTHLSSLGTALATSLETALLQVEETGKATPISQWKTHHTTTTNDGRRILKEMAGLPRMRALADVYARYQELLTARSYFDFDDMILEVIRVAEEQPALQYELQEQYQYILVDEFQDTNEGQMRLLQSITSAEVHEGRPNIMVVGDDDQAIYRFQGAEIAHILQFRERFRDPSVIVLTQNYRSTQTILDLARQTILQGQERLEYLLPEIEKNLSAANTRLGEGGIYHHLFSSRAAEYHFIAEEIAKLLKEGHNPAEIAVIGRHHKELEALSPYLQRLGLPIRYERQRNVLDEPHIRQLIQMARLVVSLLREQPGTTEYLLPEILSFPFWRLSRVTIWQLSNQAYKERRSWLECMLEHSDPAIREIAGFFQELAAAALHEPLEYMLDYLIGPVKREEDFASPFRSYYFNPEALQTDRVRYLSFLSSLKVFVEAVREYRGGSLLKLEDLLTFVDLHQKNNLPIIDVSPFLNAEQAVELLTAHKSKGLEFQTVFVLSVQENIWAGRGFASKLSFPSNVPLSPSGDSKDDKLRLFYVAITRAKEHLYLTGFEREDMGKESVRLQFLASLSPDKQTLEAEPIEVLSAAWTAYHTPPFQGDEKALLRPLVERYSLSVTHLHNFLDIAGAGPQVFLEQNLLHFPQSKSVSSAFGSAIHQTIEHIYRSLKQSGQHPDLQQVLGWYEQELAYQRLDQLDFNRFLGQGRSVLTTFYTEKKDTFSSSDEIEWDFHTQQVMLEEAQITGKIDKVIKLNQTEVSVHDFKTGKPVLSWQGKTEWEKIKLWKYRQQLLFYKLLIEHSRDFRHFQVQNGVVEFVEPTAEGAVIELDLAMDPDELERLKALIQVVYTKIKQLDFPDISGYTHDLKGIQQFEEDLLAGRI